MRLGFIGAGNMASAIITGVVRAGVLPARDVCAYDTDEKKTYELHEKLGIEAFADDVKMIESCDMALIAVKPIVVKGELTRVAPAIKGKAVISIAAGWTVEALSAVLDSTARLLRVMPNTPALCLTGMTALSDKTTFTDSEKRFAERVFSSLGLIEWVREDLINAVTGVSGSSPAFVYMFIEALADAGVACGLSRAQSVKMAAQAVKGSAEMVLQTGKHPGELKDMVCSPGGTTIEGVRVLEEKGLRAAVIDAAIAACEKAGRL